MTMSLYAFLKNSNSNKITNQIVLLLDLMRINNNNKQQIIRSITTVIIVLNRILN